MKRTTIATALALAVLALPIWDHTANAQGSHHPESDATAQPTMPLGQPAAGGMPIMMNMMSNMPMMNMMGMMGMTDTDISGMLTIDRVEGRIAFLHTELKIADAQGNVWNAFAEALRTNAKKLDEVRASMMAQPSGGQQQPPTVADRLAWQERWLLTRLEGTRTIKAAFTDLYGALSDDQKKTANELLAPHMGMGMMTMMQRKMQPGQMQPGQMRPGPMQRP
jgi:hypothetical protein